MSKKDIQDTWEWLKRIVDSCENIGQMETSLKMVRMFSKNNTLNNNQQKEADSIIDMLSRQINLQRMS
tara:strand:+ start:1003 stop:1206 length:204 start_codon:yes stop_codon:yes gene_type:complete